MEVVVTEEKKKIFCARKTMKISDRQQLENLHNTLLTANSSLTNPPPKRKRQKVVDKEPNNALDSNSSSAVSPASPASQNSPTPSLSLNLSPSPTSSESAKEKEENSSASPFHCINVELKKMEEEEQQEKKASSPPSLKESSTSAPTDAMEQDSKVITEKAKKEEAKTITQALAVDSVKDSVKDLDSSSSVPPAVSNSTEPMETDSETTRSKSTETPRAKVKVEKPSSPKATTSDSSASRPSSSRPTPSSGVAPKQKKEIKVDIKDEKEGTEVVKNGLKTQKTEVKSEMKKEKPGAAAAAKPSRPSSTPPSDTVVEEKSSSSGLKRTLSEGYEKDGQTTERDGKRPKMEGVELEAQLELKITAKANSRHKLEKIVQQLVDERLKVLELTVFDKGLQDLKDRVDKFDCTTKHQTALNTLQAKIARLAKKFGEANQMSENKRKQEALAAVAAATAVKTVTAVNVPPVQRVLHRQAVEPQPEVSREGMAPSVDKNPALSVNTKWEDEEERGDATQQFVVANRMAEFNEGKCRPDIKLRSVSTHLERVLYYNCNRSSGKPRAERYASYLFRHLVPYEIYCLWVARVNYIGMMGKDALPINLRRTMRMYIEHRFPKLSCDNWRQIRDSINEILRVKRRREFFRDYDEKSFP